MTLPPYRPLSKEIPYQDPLHLFSFFAETPWSLFLDSARIIKSSAQYSFIATEPFLTLESKGKTLFLNNKKQQGDPFSCLKILLKKFSLDSHKDLPPFQGGAAGYFSYELCHQIETLPPAKESKEQFSDMALGFYDLVIAFDHSLEQAWIFSSGYPKLDISSRKLHAKKRCAEILKKISTSKNSPSLSKSLKKTSSTKTIKSNFSRKTYEQATQRVIDYIYSGDVFEVNLSQKFSSLLPHEISAFQLYCHLRQLNAAPFAAYLCYSDTIIASSSPERFLRVRNGHVETRPIKGTRPRGNSKEEDEFLAKQLLTSEKDRAENIMIVDLMRNDLSRICHHDSIQVPQLCALESHPTVHQLVSIVQGQLQNKYDLVDLLKATFPGGSISGAPKVRAMEIITELEPSPRGPYCGSIGYLGFDQSMDTSITIRTYVIKDRSVTFQAGGAIVADSTPSQEYEETLDKAWALRETLLQLA